MVRSLSKLVGTGIWICGSIALIIWGGLQMRLSDANREPTSMTCDEFLYSPHLPGWYRLTGCQIDVDQRVDAGFNSNDKRALTDSYYIVHGSNPTQKSSLIMRVYPSDFRPDMDVMGMVINDDPAVLRWGAYPSDIEAATKFGDRIAKHWYILKQGEHPAWGFGAAMVGSGALVLILSSAVFLVRLIGLGRRPYS